MGRARGRKICEEELEMGGVRKEVFGNTFMAMPFGIDISGTVAKIGKAIFPLYLRGKLRDACHDRYKKIAAF
jgi:hypothetical protein